MAVSTGPTGAGSVVPEQTAVEKFQQWLTANNYRAASECCPHDGREGFMFAVDYVDVVVTYLQEANVDSSTDHYQKDYNAIMDYAIGIGEFADPEVYAARDAEHEKEVREQSAYEMSQLLYAYGAWAGDDPTTHQLFANIPPHGCNFVWWLRDKKCTRYVGRTTRYSWTRKTQQLLAEFLVSDYGQKHISANDVELLTAWVTEKLTPDLLMDVTPAAETLEKYRMPPVPPTQSTTDKCDGKTAQEWRDLYFQVLEEVQELRRR